MFRLLWGVGLSLSLSLLLPMTAVAQPGVTGTDEKLVGAVVEEPVRMCQTYRFKDGVAMKIGKPHPCKPNPRKQTLAWNLRGGAVLPQ